MKQTFKSYNHYGQDLQLRQKELIRTAICLRQ